MRICTFLPSATEIVASLGLLKDLKGRTYLCDYPPEVRRIPVVVRSKLNTSEMSSPEIDKRVNSTKLSGFSIYRIDEKALSEANPDLIISQLLCDVCAPSSAEVERALEILGRKVEVLELDPKGIGDILEDIIRVGAAAGVEDRAKELVSLLKDQVEQVASKAGEASYRPRVCCLEWVEPPFIGGHWVPEMVGLAGGKDGLGKKGLPSFRTDWEKIVSYDPEVVLIMPCGFDTGRTKNEVDILSTLGKLEGTKAFNRRQIWAVDANSYFSRSGPRIAEGLKILANILHPEIFAFPMKGEYAPLLP